jgi:hypothetical protein
LTQLGGGFLGGLSRAAMVDKDAAIKENTAALKDLTGSIDRTIGGRTPTTTANMVPAYTEAAKQTDLATWAATGKMPERLKAEMDRVNANQKAKEDASARQIADQQRATDERRISTQQQALKGAIGSTIGTSFGLNVPFKESVKFQAPVDLSGKPIGAMDVQSLGLGAAVSNKFLEAGDKLFNTTNALDNAIPALTKGAGLGGPDRLAPIKITTDVIERANLAPIAPEIGKGGYNPARDTLLYGSPLGALTPSVSSTTNLSSASMPDVRMNENAARQVDRLNDIKAILTSIDNKTVRQSSNSGKPLTITIS